MKICIIIPTLNRGAMLKETLKKISKCSPLPDEVIVVDQSKSSDNQLEELMRPFGGKGIILKRSMPNAQVARNQAAIRAKGDILLFLDDDIEPRSNFLSAHLDNYRDPTVHAVAGFYLEPGEVETNQTRPVIWWRPLTKIEKVPAFFSQKVDSPLWPSCNGSIRKEVFMALGGFDENFRYTLLDDTDLSVRMQRRGYRCVHDPAARVMHLKEPTGGNRPVKSEDEVIAPSARWCNWTYFFLINWGILGIGELAYRWRTHVFRRPYLIKPRLFLKASYAFLSGVIEGLALLRKGRQLGKFG